MKVNIYIGDAAPIGDKELYEKLYRMVSPERRERTDRMKQQADKCRSLAAEYLLMTACGDFGTDYYEESVTRGEYGKPYFRCGIEYSLSHSHSRVMCIMSECAAGCDTEKIGPVNMRTAERFFAPEERDLLAKCSEEERKNVFYRLWTLKESFVKCTGMGLHLPLGTFAVSLEPLGITQSYDEEKYILGEYSCGDGYCYSYCIRTDENPAVSIRHIDINPS